MALTVFSVVAHIATRKSGGGRCYFLEKSQSKSQEQENEQAGVCDHSWNCFLKGRS